MSEALTTEFVDALVARAKLNADGKIKAANRAFDRSRAIAAKIMADRTSREKIFRALTSHDSEDVAISAACYLLPIDESFAIMMLQRAEARARNPWNAIAAQYSILEWRAGRMADIRALA